MKNKTVRATLEGIEVCLVYLNGKRGQGRYAIVDTTDYTEAVSQVSWSLISSGYAVGYSGAGKKQTVYLHRLILKTIKGIKTDHINRNRLDNRRCNLRPATVQQNAFNRSKRMWTGVTSRYIGVGWHKTKKRWIAQIWVGKKPTYLGSFKNEEEAARVYDSAARARSEFAKLNFPD